MIHLFTWRDAHQKKENDKSKYILTQLVEHRIFCCFWFDEIWGLIWCLQLIQCCQILILIPLLTNTSLTSLSNWNHLSSHSKQSLGSKSVIWIILWTKKLKSERTCNNRWKFDIPCYFYLSIMNWIFFLRLFLRQWSILPLYLNYFQSLGWKDCEYYHLYFCLYHRPYVQAWRSQNNGNTKTILLQYCQEDTWKCKISHSNISLLSYQPNRKQILKSHLAYEH